MSRGYDAPLAHRYEQYVSGALPSERHQRFELEQAADADLTNDPWSGGWNGADSGHAEQLGGPA